MKTVICARSVQVIVCGQQVGSWVHKMLFTDPGVRLRPYGMSLQKHFPKGEFINMFRIPAFFIISYVSLYLVILFHELGHSLFYQIYGVKKNFLRVTVRPYLFFSTPAPVDEEAAKGLGTGQNLMVSYAGVAVNLIIALCGYGVLRYGASVAGGYWNDYVLLFLCQTVTLHLAEAVSYLVIGNIYPVSDMKNIAELVPWLRIPNFLAGLLVCLPYLMLLRRISGVFLPAVLISNGLTVVCMGVGRVIFTVLESGNREESGR